GEYFSLVPLPNCLIGGPPLFKLNSPGMAIDESSFRVKPGVRVRISDYDPADTRLMLVIILQGMDASGKDGTVKHVMTGLNPRTCRVVSFKVPAGEELEHDYLWRIERAMPPKGYMGVFNRSQYEDVLAA